MPVGPVLAYFRCLWLGHFSSRLIPDVLRKARLAYCGVLCRLMMTECQCGRGASHNVLWSRAQQAKSFSFLPTIGQAVLEGFFFRKM